MWYYGQEKRLPRNRTCSSVLLTVFVLIALPAFASTPEWLRTAAGTPIPAYPPETKAVQLLDEKITSVRDDGEIHTTYRRAFKILRPEGRDYGIFTVFYDDDTRLTLLKAWCIPAKGPDYEMKEKDAVETGFVGGSFYDENRQKTLRIQAADPGSVVGCEYEQRRRPFVLQDKWIFQDTLPVYRARFTLQLPKGWEYKVIWLNYPEQQPHQSGENAWTWEIEDLPPIDPEEAMPAWRAVAGWLAVLYVPRDPGQRDKSHASWNELGAWYAQLASGRREAAPEMKQKVTELTAASNSTMDKIRALAAFVQREIRYVAIEIGIGGYQPHYAAEIYANRYGDCKDKATLLSAFLKMIGIDSYYVLINVDRGATARDFPSILNFNHVVLAIRLPEGEGSGGLFAVREHPRFGRLLFFDPTSRITPIGDLPDSLQKNECLLVTESGSELIKLPLLPADANRLNRQGKLKLSSTGSLSGTVQEIRSGYQAAQARNALLSVEGAQRNKVLELLLGQLLGRVTLRAVDVENLDKIDDTLIIRYEILADNYAKFAGNLLLLRPRVLGEKGDDMMEGKERRHPVEFPSTRSETDVYEIILPDGFKADELPPPTELDVGFAEYHSKVELEKNVLRYKRDFRLKEVLVTERSFDDLKRLYRVIASDERNAAVLARVNP